MGCIKIPYDKEEALEQNWKIYRGSVGGNGAAEKNRVSAYRYGFNGKEKDQNGEFGLNSYDYGFRIYNPAIGKFLSVDPLTQSYPWLTPYQFAGNSPVANVDLDGLEPDYYLNQKRSEILGNGTVTAATDATGIITAAQKDAKFTIMHGARIKQEQLRLHLEASRGTIISSNDLTSTQQYKVFEQNFNAYGDFFLPLDVTKRLVKGEEVSNAELGIEALGLIPAGKLLGKGFKLLKGTGGEILETFVKKVDNQASHLTDKDLSGAIKDIFGNPVVINGKTYDHLNEVTEALHGLGKQLNNLNKAIDGRRLTGDVLDQAKRLRTSLQKQKDKIQNVLNKAKKQASELSD